MHVPKLERQTAFFEQQAICLKMMLHLEVLAQSETPTGQHLPQHTGKEPYLQGGQSNLNQSRQETFLAVYFTFLVDFS
jgi:hypothetical protein